MTPSIDVERQHVERAIAAAWLAEADRVQKFGLTVQASEISHSPAGWSVPVISGVPTGSAAELVRTLNRLQELAETSTNLSISIFLDPFAKTKSA